MEIINTKTPQFKPSVVMMIYGEGGVGKTTFASTAPKPLLADCENGAKYFGLRGVELDVGQISKWIDMKDFIAVANSDQYETIIIDPIGELMEKLKVFMIGQGNTKLVQRDGSPTAAGWGWLKDQMRNVIKVLRDSGKHVIFIAHIEEKGDEDRLVKRPMIQTKLSEELVNMVDVVGYMTSIEGEQGSKRVIFVDPESDKYIAKDRTGQLGKIIEPDFTKIIKACQGTETYAWSNSSKAKKEEPKEDAETKTPKKSAPKKPAKKLPAKKVDVDQDNIPCETKACKNKIGIPVANFSEKVYGKRLCQVCQSKSKIKR